MSTWMTTPFSQSNVSVKLYERVHTIGWKVAFLWLAERRETSDWLQILPCWKKRICGSRHVRGVSKRFTHKCSDVHKCRAVCECRFNSLWINITIYIQMQGFSQMQRSLWMQIQQFVNKYHNKHICFKRKLQIILNIDICGFPLQIYKTSNICVCIRNTFVNFEKYLWVERHLYINPSIHLWILLCAFIYYETDLTP